MTRHTAGQTLALLALTAVFTAHLTAAALANVPVLAAAAALGLLIDGCLHLYHPDLVNALARIRLDVTVRQLLRDLLTAIALLRLGELDPIHEYAPLLAGLLCCYAVHIACQAIAVLVRRSRTLPFVTRNIDADALNLSAAPPQLLTRRAGHRLLLLSAATCGGLTATAATGEVLWSALGVGSALLAATAGTAWLAGWLLPGRRPLGEQQALEWLDMWLADYRPTIGLYFSGGTASAYQANMWLSTLAELDGKPIIVLRERFMVQKIEATDIPVVCIPKVANLMRLEQSTLKVLLHPANSGKTSQILRIPSIKHAFTNHGESDKLSSCNPYAKAYDEVWVAGPAARERYAQADVGVDDEEVVEVGRPQLASIAPYAAPPSGEWTTVLYAPTWEGWDGQPGNTSIILAGENLVRLLLADPGVRLLYKPHPMTGSVDPRAGLADERIRAMILDANRKRAATRPAAAPAVGSAAADLDRRTADLDRLTTPRFRACADDVERMLEQGEPEPGRAAAVAAATSAWETAYWASLPAWQHQIITATRPALYSCFNQADLLISDVSSVISDFLASEKPYAVANTTGQDESDFRSAFPTVRAATVLTPDAGGVPALLDAVRDPALDRFATARPALREYLLGPCEPSSLVRFKAAALALADAADARRRRMDHWQAAEHRVVRPRSATAGAGTASGTDSPAGRVP